MASALSGLCAHTYALWNHGYDDDHIYMSSTDGAARNGTVSYNYNNVCSGGNFRGGTSNDIATRIHIDGSERSLRLVPDQPQLALPPVSDMKKNHFRKNLAGSAAIGLTTLGLGFAGANAVAPAVFGQTTSPSDIGPTTERVVVASGESARFGRWEIVTSQTADGQLCRGVRFLDTEAHLEVPALAEGCGGSAVSDHVASLTLPGTTFVYGRVAPEAAAVKVRSGGVRTARAAASELHPIQGKDGASYVAGEVPGGDPAAPNVEAVAVSDDGSGLGRVDATDPSVAGR